MKVKLDSQSRAKICEMKNDGGHTNKEIAEKFGVSETTVRRVVKSFCLFEESTTEDKSKENQTVEKKIYEPITKRCTSCGDEFTISPAEQKILEKKGYQLPNRCRSCRAAGREIIRIECVDCGKEFTITVAEKVALESRGLKQPKRCPSCIKFKREANAAREAAADYMSPSLDFDPDKD